MANDLERIRNLGIVAHIDAGKTTVSEHLLFDTGVQHRFGNVDDGDTTLDWMEEERERGITITAAATSVPWRGHRLNVIDTPGHVDFTVEVERSMRVLDGAVLVVDGVMGVQAQTETVWRQMVRHRVPALVFVNKLDRPGHDHLRVVEGIRRRLGAPAVPIQYPLYRSDGATGAVLAGLVDLLTLQTWTFEPDSPAASPRELPIPADAADEIGVLRAELLEALASDDDELLELVTEGREVPVPTALAALRRCTIARSIVPVLCGAALRNFGIHPLLDAIVDLLPSPVDLPPVQGRRPDDESIVERPPRPDAPLSALAFKLQLTPHGDLTFVRIYSGTIEPGTGVYNVRQRRHERVARVLRIHAQHGQALERAVAGDIVALVGLKVTATGDTLCTKDEPLVLESLTVPDPVLTLWIEPKSTADRDRLQTALQRLAHEDPSFHVGVDEDTGRWLASGMGELHLEVIRHRIEHEFHVPVSVGEPRVSYREAVRAAATGKYRVERSLGGREVFGEVVVAVAPDDAVEHVAVEWGDGCPIPAAFRATVAEALVIESQAGPRFGYPLVRARIRVVGGASDKQRDNEAAFSEASAKALREALASSGVDLLEPWMRIEVQTRAEHASAILSDLNARRAEVEDVAIDGEQRTITGGVALSRMFGYASSIRSLSQGSAAFSLTPAGFRRVPDGELAERGLVWE
ncbi:MAG: elongation factor G [Planctomycetes bacterium]|nr:elongation factor G [Planctomycetota bacterium]